MIYATLKSKLFLKGSLQKLSISGHLKVLLKEQNKVSGSVKIFFFGCCNSLKCSPFLLLS